MSPDSTTAQNAAPTVSAGDAGERTGEVSHLLRALTAVAEQIGDSNAVESVQVEAEAVTAHAARVVVVGEKKRGKSSLINALLRRPGLLPVDADIATSVHLSVYAADREQAYVIDDSAPEGREISLAQIGEYAALDPDTLEMRHPDVQEVRVGLPDPLLRAGLELIDTPGVGGLMSGHAALTLAALSLADALLFVVDGSRELTASECAFLAKATERVATVKFVLTQTDKYKDWRQVLMADQALIVKHAPRFTDAQWFPVSSRLRLDAAGAAEADDAARAADLEQRSGFASLEEALTGQIAGRAAELREINAAWVARRVLDTLIAGQKQQLQLLSKNPDLVDHITAMSNRLKDCRRDDAAWRQDLNRKFKDLGPDMNALLLRKLAKLRNDAFDWAAEAKTATTTQITHDLDARVHAVWNEMGISVREAALGVATKIAGNLDTEGINALAFDTPYPQELEQLSAFKRSAEDQGQGMSGMLNRYWPSMSGFSVTSMAGHLMFATVNPLALIGVGAVVAASVYKASQARLETLRVRDDVQRYTQAVMTEVFAEMPPAIQKGMKAMQTAIEDFINNRMRVKQSELEAAIAEAKDNLDASEEDLAPKRASTEQTLHRLRKLASLAERLTTPVAAPAFGAL